MTESVNDVAHIEMIDHLFFECQNIKCRWREIKLIIEGLNLGYVIQEMIFVTIAQAIWQSKRRLTMIIMIAEICNTIWMERNVIVYSRKYSIIPNWTIIS